MTFKLMKISNILNMEDNTEREFFSWLKEENIMWTKQGTDLDNILIDRADFDKIKEAFPDVESL